MLRRRLLRAMALGLILALGGITWLRSAPPPGDAINRLSLKPLAAVPLCCTAGPLHLVGAWQLTSSNTMFGGYSGLIATGSGRLLALSDRGYYLAFTAPDRPSGGVSFGPLLDDRAQLKANRDIEAGTRDPATGQIWIAQEGRNAIERKAPDLSRQAFRQIPEMRDWPANTGPESLVRLGDGRFIALCECSDGWSSSGRHRGLLFAGDPTEDTSAQAFQLAGAKGYRPTAVAELPDGRVLILARRLVWPVPARFGLKILLADPAAITPGDTWQAQELAELLPPWPMDNYEGLVIERQDDGRLIAWLISDENGAVAQRVLLLKVEIDESRLPQKQKAPG